MICYSHLDSNHGSVLLGFEIMRTFYGIQDLLFTSGGHM